MDKIEIRVHTEDKAIKYDGCYNCVHFDDAEELCILRKCVHAFNFLKECYKPKGGKEQNETDRG